MEDTVQVLHFHKEKGPHRKNMGRYYVNKEATSDKLNYKHAIYPNIIFETILKN